MLQNDPRKFVYKRNFLRKIERRHNEELPFPMNLYDEKKYVSKNLNSSFSKVYWTKSDQVNLKPRFTECYMTTLHDIGALFLMHITRKFQLET